MHLQKKRETKPMPPFTAVLDHVEEDGIAYYTVSHLSSGKTKVISKHETFNEAIEAFDRLRKEGK